MKRVLFLISCFVFAFTSCVFSVQLEQGRYGLKVIKDNLNMRSPNG